ncbi:MAG: diacylglycerol kinase family lipid kinase [Caldilineaceae bacterium]|nr:diacylglycerol kinase family lipid kinase [Caldilineaceae bacterium]
MSMIRPKQVYVIINPAAGQNVPVLATLNTVFQEQRVEWHAVITHRAGDGRRLAEEAVARGVDVVAAYGGDGTVAEVASALIGTDIPLAILPGGTANVLSLELGIPGNLVQAARLATGLRSRRRKIDAGEVNGHHFLLRVGIGFEAGIVQRADRSLKDRLGFFAYIWGGMQNLRQPPKARYHMILDGKEIISEGVTCGIANSGNLGQANLKLSKHVDVSDGLLDVLLVEQASMQAVIELLSNIFGIRETPIETASAQVTKWNTELQQLIRHWQAREVSLTVTPDQPVQYDGEVLDGCNGGIHCKILPRALTVIVPW